MVSKRTLNLALVAALLLALTTGIAGVTRALSTQAPLGTAFTYQGYLSDGSGTVDRTCDFTFRLYDALEGGTLLGTEPKPGVAVEAGTFTVQLDFGGDAFNGKARWLEIDVDCGGAATTLTPRQPLTAAPYALYAPSAGSAPWAGLTGVPPGFVDGIDHDSTYTNGLGLLLTGNVFSADTGYLQRRVAGACPAGQSIRAVHADGSVDCEIDDAGGGGGDNFWSLSGNAGTDPATTYLGTGDNQALELRVNGNRALRLEPHLVSPNLIGGHSANSVTSGTVGATIGGGGRSMGVAFQVPNHATDNYGTVSGGAGNNAGDGDTDTANSPYATVGGGSYNEAAGAYATIAGGSWNQVLAAYATIAGGGASDPADAEATRNRVFDDYGTIGGGGHNQAGSDDADPASATYATVGGGSENVASGSMATIGGGYFNTASGGNAAVGGGSGNSAGGNASTAGGGMDNYASGDYASLGGGITNSASGSASTLGGGNGNSASGDYATLGGGSGNSASAEYATLGGGQGNAANGAYTTVAGGYANIASIYGTTVGGGQHNDASASFATVSGGEQNDASGVKSTVGGGGGNSASGYLSTVGGGGWNEAAAAYATIGGGGPSDPEDAEATRNRVFDDYGTIGGGGYNRVGSDEPESEDAPYATVGGGYRNIAISEYATIGGGILNIARGDRATVAGGWNNSASAAYATVGGGLFNTARGYRSTISGGDHNDATTWHTTIGGGESNIASGQAATVGGGKDNTASGNWATVPGGNTNDAAGDLSLAAGTHARALHDSTFVWASCGPACVPATAPPFESTGANQFLVRAQGGVGLGTNSPANQLHVREVVTGSATPGNHVAQIENGASDLGGDVLALMVGQTEDPDAATNFLTFFKGGGNHPIGSIEGDGSGGVTLNSGGGDYAEWLPRLEPADALAPGDVVGIHGGRVSLRTSGAERVMVVSRAPIVLGNNPGHGETRRYEKVAFIGQVEVKVRGPVEAGDWLVPSGDEDGTAITLAEDLLTAEQFGQVVGQAWESSDGPGVRLVLALVGYGPPASGLARQIEALQAENAALAARLAALEAQIRTGAASRVQLPVGWLLPGTGLLLLALGLVLQRRNGGHR
jgi:hypothetical protein